MRRTLNEIHRICQKAAEGAGAPPGVDTDAADGAVWLAARGLDPLGGLAAALEGMDGQAGNGGLAAAGDTLDAAGKPGALIAPALVDLLASAAMADGRTARLRTVGLSAPLFLLPGATRYAEDGWGFRFTAADAEDRRFVLIVAPGAGVAITASAEVASIGAALGNCVPFDVDMVCARDTDASTGEFETEAIGFWPTPRRLRRPRREAWRTASWSRRNLGTGWRRSPARCWFPRRRNRAAAAPGSKEKRLLAGRSRWGQTASAFRDSTGRRGRPYGRIDLR